MGTGTLRPAAALLPLAPLAPTAQRLGVPMPPAAAPTPAERAANGTTAPAHPFAELLHRSERQAVRANASSGASPQTSGRGAGATASADRPAPDADSADASTGTGPNAAPTRNAVASRDKARATADTSPRAGPDTTKEAPPTERQSARGGQRGAAATDGDTCSSPATLLERIAAADAAGSAADSVIVPASAAGRGAVDAAGDAVARADADAALAGDASPSRRGPGLVDARATVDLRRADAAGAALAGAHDDAATRRDPGPFALLVESTGRARSTHDGAPGVTPLDGGAAALAASSSPAAAMPEATPAASASATLAAAIDAPDFAAALGVHVSVLARDGVQQAELHLNPAETGPVSIQITLDGTNARVDFGADLAATREAIERGLPELAASLRDAGFTLSGGGVSQHAGDKPGPGHGGTRAIAHLAEIDETAAATGGTRIARHVAAGGVDLYA